MVEAALAPSASNRSGVANLRPRPFPKGVSGNPTGRPKGERGLAAYIRRRTRDGREMADVMLAIMRDPDEASHDRIAAASWLTNRAVGPADALPAGTTLTVFTLRIGGRDDDD